MVCSFFCLLASIIESHYRFSNWIFTSQSLNESIRNGRRGCSKES